MKIIKRRTTRKISRPGNRRRRRRTISRLHCPCYHSSFRASMFWDALYSLLDNDLFNSFLVACQLCLGLWQFCKLTPAGALIQGVIGWLVQPLGLSPLYSSLQPCEGRVFKRTNCFVLQADIPSDRTSISNPEVNTMNLYYLSRDYLLERKGENSNMLFIDHKLCYYITHLNWEELHNLKKALCYGLEGPARARVAVAGAAVELSLYEALSPGAERNRAAATARDPAAAVAARARDPAVAVARARAAELAGDPAVAPELAPAVAELAPAAKLAPALAALDPAKLAPAVAALDPSELARARARALALDPALFANPAVDAALFAALFGNPALFALFAARDPALTAAVDAYLAALVDADTARTTLFVKGKREFLKQVITGGVMPFKEVADAIILYNQHVGARLNDEWLLPINLPVSGEKLLKIINLVALFFGLMSVSWLIPLALSFISGLLQFSTTLRVLLYNEFNVLFCYIMHLACDPLPRSWRRQVYSLGKNLTPCNDIQLKVVRGNMCAVISGGAEIGKEGAISVPLLNMSFTSLYGVIEQRFRCDPIESDIRCIYVPQHHLCQISASTISMFYVKCENEDIFRRIITLVSCIAESRCGSLISYGPKNKVRVRGFQESVTCYVNDGFPPIYRLELENVLVR